VDELIQKAKDVLAKGRQWGKDSSGAALVIGENGPANFAMIQALIDVVEAQGQEIAELKRKVGV
jgi:hypothetical protein